VDLVPTHRLRFLAALGLSASAHVLVLALLRPHPATPPRPTAKILPISLVSLPGGGGGGPQPGEPAPGGSTPGEVAAVAPPPALDLALPAPAPPASLATAKPPPRLAARAEKPPERLAVQQPAKPKPPPPAPSEAAVPTRPSARPSEGVAPAAGDGTAGRRGPPGTGPGAGGGPGGPGTGDGSGGDGSGGARPAYGTNPKPPYPLAARRLGLEGVVTLEVVVRPDGSPAEVLVRRSSGHTMLDDSALATVRTRWRFIPARHGDVPVESRVTFPVRFTLREG